MSKNIILSTFYLLLAHFIYAQPTLEWQKTFGGSFFDEAKSIQLTNDDGYIVLGVTASINGDVFGNHGGTDFWAIKLSSTGTVQWKKVLGGSDNDSPHFVQTTHDGGYILAGSTQSDDFDVAGYHGGIDGWVIKLSSTGNVEWQRALGGSDWDEIWCIEQTVDGGYIAAGRSKSIDGDATDNHGDLDFWVVKLDDTGIVQWQKSLGGSKQDIAYSVSQTSDHGYIVAGQTASFDGDVTGNNGNVDYWVVKLAENGQLEWQNTFGGSGADTASEIHQISDGYILVGYSGSNDGDVTGHHGLYDYWVVKLDNTGTLIWQKALGGSDADWGESLVSLNNGGFVIAGSSRSSDGDVTDTFIGQDFWVVELNALGEMVWQKALGGSQTEDCFSIRQTSDNGFILAGYTWSTNGDVTGSQVHGYNDFWIVKLSPSSVGVEETPKSKLAFLKIYPNPACQSVSLQLPVDEPDIAVSIYDLAGREICRETIQNGGGLEVVSLARGLYLVSATTPDGKVFWGKFEKM